MDLRISDLQKMQRELQDAYLDAPGCTALVTTESIR